MYAQGTYNEKVYVGCGPMKFKPQVRAKYIYDSRNPSFR